MTEFRGCWDVGRDRRTHSIRSIDGLSRATVPERAASAVGEFCGVVLWISIELYPGEARPSLGERASDRSRCEDGVDPLEGNGC